MKRQNEIHRSRIANMEKQYLEQKHEVSLVEVSLLKRSQLI